MTNSRLSFYTSYTFFFFLLLLIHSTIFWFIRPKFSMNRSFIYIHECYTYIISLRDGRSEDTYFFSEIFWIISILHLSVYDITLCKYLHSLLEYELFFFFFFFCHICCLLDFFFMFYIMKIWNHCELNAIDETELMYKHNEFLSRERFTFGLISLTFLYTYIIYTFFLLRFIAF